MSFIVTSATPAAAIAQNGTLNFAYPANAASGDPSYPYPFDPTHQPADLQGLVANEQTSAGDFASSNQHYAYATGNQAKLLVGRDFSLSFSNTVSSGITMTYLGVSPLPAGMPVNLQLEFVGQNDGAVFTDDSRLPRASASPVAVVRFGTPVAANTTGVLATTAVAVTTVVPLPAPVVLDCARNLTYVSSNSGDTTQTITARGLDEFGNAMTEIATLNGTTSVVGKKAFKTVQSYQASAALTGNLSLGWGVLLGFPITLEAKGYAIAENVDNAVPTRGTYASADNTVPSGTTGDVRGTYSPNSAPNAAHAYEVMIVAPSPKYFGLPQYAG